MSDQSVQHSARLAGVLYLFIIFAGIFGQVFVRSALIVSGDPAATVLNISSSELLFRTGIVAELLMLVCDIALAMMFYKLLRPINKDLALFAAFLRIAMSAVSAVNVLNQMDVLLWIQGMPYAAMQAEMINTMAYQALKSHAFGYHISLVFFGFHCFVIGALIYRARYFPKVIGFLLMVASLCYLTNSLVNILAPSLSSYLGIAILLPALVAELSLALWLLFKGVDMHEWLVSKEDSCQ